MSNSTTQVMKYSLRGGVPLFLGEWGIYLSEIAAWIGAALLLMGGYYHRIRRLEKQSGPREAVNGAKG